MAIGSGEGMESVAPNVIVEQAYKEFIEQKLTDEIICLGVKYDTIYLSDYCHEFPEDAEKKMDEISAFMREGKIEISIN